MGFYRRAFDQAIDNVTAAATELIRSLVTNAEPRDREIEARRAQARNAVRFTLHKQLLSGRQSPAIPVPPVLSCPGLLLGLQKQPEKQV